MSWRQMPTDRNLHDSCNTGSRQRSRWIENEDCNVGRILNLGASILLGLAFVAWPVFEHPVSRLSYRQDGPRIQAPSSGRPLALQPAALPSFDSDGEPNTNGPSCAPAVPGSAGGTGAPYLTGIGAFVAGSPSFHTGQRLPRWGSALPPPPHLSA